MKRLAVIVLAGLLGAAPAMAAHHEGKAMEPKEEVRECALQAESIQKKMKRIQSEIGKGSKKYTPEEMKALNDKLKEANELLDTISKQ